MRNLACGLVLLVLMFLGACGKKQEAQANGAQPAQQPAASPAQAPPVTASQASQPSPASSAQTIEGDLPGTKLEIKELKRTGNSATLRFTLTSDKGLSFGTRFAESGQGRDYGTVGGLHLLDSANNKKYFVVRDSEGTCLCSREIPDIAANSSALLWAKFPAPPENVQKVTIEVPHFPPIEDVPITH